MKRFWRAATAAGVTAAACLVGGPAALAHEQRQVGAYQFTVGWSHEPTYVGAENSIQLFVHDAHGNPIDDLGSPPTLQVEVIFGTQTSSPLDLEPSFDPDTGLGTHGEFDAAIIPTTAGNYTFHFYGSVNGQKVDERFTSGPTTFNTVADPTGVEFPAKVPTLPDLASLTARLSPRVDHATALASASTNRANSAHTLGLVGLILGAAGLVAGVGLGGAGLMLGRRPAANGRDRSSAGVPGA
ncbi:MAG TPA: hypothetical protein VFV02_09220 [Acidimicrobiales bacterium]|nr:hypothetical protein [Acidimicrobiales bacterium]